MAKKFNLAEYVKAEGVSDSDQITMIPWTHIRANVRNFYEVADVADLADSIQLNGLMDPLVVYKGDGILYTILSGHRRYRAITELRQREGCEHLYDEIPCMVRAKPSSTAMEDILLIQANSTGRIRTPKDMATEAERLTAALVKLKKDGAELPGRMRDIVADAMGVSSSKLARMTAIKNNLRVPGFRGAYDRQELSEAAAYEISQMNEADQYHMLDRAIDAGLDYETLDIKSVQKLRRQIEAGESTKQDLYIEAEKRGIKIKDEDFSPLLAALVAEAIPTSWRKGLRSCRTKAEGLEHLHRFGFQHCSHWGTDVCYDSDPQALTLKKPICRRIKWAEVWDLLALWDMHGAGSPKVEAEPAPVVPPDPEAPDVMAAPTVAVAGGKWRSCRDDPPEGWALCFMFHPWAHAGHDYDLILTQYHNGRWFGVWEDSEDEIEIDMYDRWCPAPPVPEEVWE